MSPCSSSKSSLALATSSPPDAKDYRARYLVQDIAALIASESGDTPVAALVAHDWGGAVAWNLANQQPQLLERLVLACTETQ